MERESGTTNHCVVQCSMDTATLIKLTILIAQKTHVSHEGPVVLKGSCRANAVKCARVVIKKGLKHFQLSQVGLHVRTVSVVKSL